MNNLECYYAINRNGQGYVFIGEPTRNEQCGCWVGVMSYALISILYRLEKYGFSLPDMKWEDNPVKLNLSLSYGK